MKKIARLEWIADHYGREFVQPYIVCTDWKAMQDAAEWFNRRSVTWGIRTDADDAYGFHLPFVLNGTLQAAQTLWNEWGSKLIYIVVANITRYHVNAVAQRIDEEHVHFEYNAVDHDWSQRMMYNDPSHLSHLSVGPMRRPFLLRDFGRAAAPALLTFDTEPSFAKVRTHHGCLDIEEMGPGFRFLGAGYPFTPIGPVFTDEDNTVRDLRFHVIYHLMQEHPYDPEVTFSVRLPDKRVTIW